MLLFHWWLVEILGYNAFSSSSDNWRFRTTMSESTSVRNQVDVQVGDLLRDGNLTLAVAESCTGGLISHKITNVPGSSEYFNRAVVAYSNRAKRELLDVKDDSLQSHGAVSEVVASEMAEGIRVLSETDLGLSTTGIAGPGGGTAEKPVGLVYLGLSDPEGTRVKKLSLAGNRWENKCVAATEAIEYLIDFLEDRC